MVDSKTNRLLSILLDTRDAVGQIRETSKSIQVCSNKQDLTVLQDKQQILVVSLVKLFADFIFVVCDVAKLNAPTLQIVAGLTAASMGTTKLVLKNQ